jgi:L-fuculose-phosphate aldolase
MIAMAGGDTICCALHATFDTDGLSKHVVRVPEGHVACPPDHHCMVAIGPSLRRALWLTIEVETLARQYHGRLQIGKPPLLSGEEIELVRRKMTGYGHADT